MDEFEFWTDLITDYGTSASFIQIFLILADNQNWNNILSEYIPDHCFKFSIINYGVSKHAGSQVSDRCPLSYLFYSWRGHAAIASFMGLGLKQCF